MPYRDSLSPELRSTLDDVAAHHLETSFRFFPVAVRKRLFAQALRAQLGWAAGRRLRYRLRYFRFFAEVLGILYAPSLTFSDLLGSERGSRFRGIHDLFASYVASSCEQHDNDHGRHIGHLSCRFPRVAFWNVQWLRNLDSAASKAKIALLKRYVQAGHICCLSETHWVGGEGAALESTLGCRILSSQDGSMSGGVAILLPNVSKWRYVDHVVARVGYCLVVKFCTSCSEANLSEFCVASCYIDPADIDLSSVALPSALARVKDFVGSCPLIAGGDFNVKPYLSLTHHGREEQSEADDSLVNGMGELGLSEVPLPSQVCTYRVIRQGQSLFSTIDRIFLSENWRSANGVCWDIKARHSGVPAAQHKVVTLS